jgi:tetratricopeptide (TPR) repeat protein
MVTPATSTAQLQHAARLHQAQQFEAAEAAYRALLAAEPNHPEALHLLGMVAQQTKRPDQAEKLVSRAVALRPRMAVYRASLGQVLRDCGKLEAAILSYRHAIRLEPKSAGFHQQLASVLVLTDRDAEAERSLREALRLDPAFLPARLDLAYLLRRLGRAPEAEATLRETLQHHAANRLVQLANGAVLFALNQLSHAVLAWRHGLSGASAADFQGLPRERLEEAALACQHLAVATPPDRIARALLPQVQHLLGRARASHGLVFRDAGQHAKALGELRESADLVPGDPEIRTSLAHALLLQGDEANGWAAFEARLRTRDAVPSPGIRWHGETTSQTVLIRAEQGAGDTIQFARFLPLAAQRAPIVCSGPPTLARLFATLHPPVPFVAEPDIPDHALQCPLMSLPFTLGVAQAANAAATPYLQADPHLTAAWRDRLAPLPGKRIGIVWAGNPRYRLDHRRSIPPADLAPLLRAPGHSFVSLQVGAAQAGLSQIDNNRVADLGAALTDFADTAALIAALDLVISVDTATAHLTGALGAPVWLLNRIDTDWRWGASGETTPWYPSMRIFRQTRVEQWSDVIRAVITALKA